MKENFHNEFVFDVQIKKKEASRYYRCILYRILKNAVM